MKTTIYNILNIKMEAVAALSFYHQLRSFIRLKDKKSFGCLMGLNSTNVKDSELMGAVISIMQTKHPLALEQYVIDLKQ
ncbi:hypothetical protein H7F15_05885 [Pontibacter sp. Tf4]|uniref:hypothetical protein n=1 Tax=Pontibacter sp. Tf4 TaxID=2761620 RepID=UPI001623E3A5|nr:hypothetical protein [Pontibacter sp. Tf4]MBB6610559.1 hypothetical protein [Pontibacter sp. Tf4]